MVCGVSGQNGRDIPGEAGKIYLNPLIPDGRSADRRRCGTTTEAETGAHGCRVQTVPGPFLADFC